MGKTSAEVKNRYAAKAYDRITILVAKGKKEVIQCHATGKGYKSLNAYINKLIADDMAQGK